MANLGLCSLQRIIIALLFLLSSCTAFRRLAPTLLLRPMPPVFKDRASVAQSPNIVRMPVEFQVGNKLGTTLEQTQLAPSDVVLEKVREVRALGEEARQETMVRIVNDATDTADRSKMEEELLQKVKDWRMRALSQKYSVSQKRKVLSLLARRGPPAEEKQKIEEVTEEMKRLWLHVPASRPGVFAAKKEKIEEDEEDEDDMLDMDGRARFNFAPASTRDNILYTANTPALPQVGEEESNFGQRESAAEWVAHMKAHNVTRVVSLVDDQGLAWWLTQAFGQHFKVAANVPTGSPDAWRQIHELVREAEGANEKIVLHCPNGEDRAGRVAAAWLVARYGMSAVEAAQEVVRQAEACGAERKGDVMKLARYLEAGHEAWRPVRVRRERGSRFNCALASNRDLYVYAAQAPGVRGQGRKAPEAGSIKEEDKAVQAWIKHVKAQRVTRVVSVLDSEELEWYAGSAGLMGLLEQHFGRSRCHSVPLPAAASCHTLLNHLHHAEAAGERILVCSARGSERSGRVLAAWLMGRHGLSGEAAALEVMAEAHARGVQRTVDLQKLLQLVDTGCESWRC